ncbi:MAG: hypothetical protein Q9216_003228 [Gyalolechia sp. 2 TL-2023]
MAARSPSRILDALKVVCTSPEEGLECHLAEVEEALGKLQRCVQRHRPRTTGFVAPQPSPQPANSSDGIQPPVSRASFCSSPASSLIPSETVATQRLPIPATSPVSSRVPSETNLPNQATDPSSSSPEGQSLSSNVKHLIQSLLKDFSKVKQQIKEDVNEPHSITLAPPLERTDARIADVILAEGLKDTLSVLRRGLAKRSLATDYQHWERRKYPSNKPADLFTRDQNETQTPHLTSFLVIPHLRESFAQYPFHVPDQHIARAKAAVRSGWKLLTLEKFLDNVGFSALVIFQYNKFRRLNYQDLIQFASALQKQEKLQAFAKQKTSWLLQWQEKYDGSKDAPMLNDQNTNATTHHRDETSTALDGSEEASTHNPEASAAPSPNDVQSPLQEPSGQHSHYQPVESHVVNQNWRSAPEDSTAYGMSDGILEGGSQGNIAGEPPSQSHGPHAGLETPTGSCDLTIHTPYLGASLENGQGNLEFGKSKMIMILVHLLTRIDKNFFQPTELDNDGRNGEELYGPATNSEGTFDVAYGNLVDCWLPLDFGSTQPPGY